MRISELVINALRTVIILACVCIVFFGGQYRLMAHLGGAFLLLSILECVLQFIFDRRERRKNVNKQDL